MDIACGVGYGTRILVDERADIEAAVGVDLSADAIEYARTRYAHPRTRYEVGDEDVLSILSTRKLTNKEVADRTGRSEATISRLEKVAGHPWAWEVIRGGVLGYNVMGKLIDACNSNVQKQS